jgi:hypothetical protein
MFEITNSQDKNEKRFKQEFKYGKNDLDAVRLASVEYAEIA